MGPTGLQDSNITSVSTYDAELLKEGYTLGDDMFNLMVSIEQISDFDYSKLESIYKTESMIDPRFGTL